MAKYRKKPVVIQAEQFIESDYPDYPKGVFSLQNEVILSGFGVLTIHGDVAIVRDGDWIIAESDGEHYYPCKPDIFEATYEKV